MNVVRQTPIVNLATLLLVVAVAFVRHSVAEFPAERIPDITSALGRGVSAFQGEHPTIAAWLAAMLLLVAGWFIGQVVKVRDLYFVKTTITIPLYGIIACGVFISEDSLLAAIVSLLLVLAMRNFYSSFRNGYSFSPLFFGSMALGIIPLLYAPSLLLMLLMPLSVIVFKRSAREAIVAIVGLLLPAATICYITWGMGGEFLQPVETTLATALMTSGYRLFGHLSLGSAMIICYLLSLVLSAIFFCWINIYSMGTRARYITIFNMCAFVLSLSALAAPAGTTTSFGLVAVPAAMMIPAMLVRLKASAANLLYLILLLLFTLHLFIA